MLAFISIREVIAIPCKEILNVEIADICKMQSVAYKRLWHDIVGNIKLDNLFKIGSQRQRVGRNSAAYSAEWEPSCGAIRDKAAIAPYELEYINDDQAVGWGDVRNPNDMPNIKPGNVGVRSSPQPTRAELFCR